MSETRSGRHRTSTTARVPYVGVLLQRHAGLAGEGGGPVVGQLRVVLVLDAGVRQTVADGHALQVDVHALVVRVALVHTVAGGRHVVAAVCGSSNVTPRRTQNGHTRLVAACRQPAHVHDSPVM